jgi:hypothetical protein
LPSTSLTFTTLTFTTLLKQPVSGLEQSQPGGGGAGGGCGDEGGEGGACGGFAGGSPHASDDQMKESSCPQPVPQPQSASSDTVHSRPPCASHSAAASYALNPVPLPGAGDPGPLP